MSRLKPLLLLASVFIFQVLAYDVPCPYSEKDFPLKTFAPDFRLPLSPESTLIVYPPACKKEALTFQAKLKEKCGVAVPLESGANATTVVTGGRHLIVAGNLMNNPVMTELYKKRVSFYDAALPGTGGFALHTTPSPWNMNANLYLVGFSRDQDAAAAFDAALSAIPIGAKQLGVIRNLKGGPAIPKPFSPDSMTRLFGPCMANPEGVMAPYNLVGDQGLFYSLTGDTAYALAFKQGFKLILERAKKAGDWVPETWTFVYFDLSRIILTWRLIEEDPVFSARDREMVCRIFYGLGRFVMTGPVYLKPEWLPEGDQRQNHPLFLAFTQYMVRQYFKERFGLTDFDPMVPVYTAAFAGQELHYLPNDNAWGYLTLAPAYAAAYFLHNGNTAFLTQGVKAKSADGLIITLDNLRTQVTFGDIGTYTRTQKNVFTAQTISMAAWAGRDGACQWVYRWLLPANLPVDGRTLSLGSYISDVEPVAPKRFCGVFALPADTGTLRWAASRTITPEHIADPRRTWLDKLSMRRAFDPDAEYLMMTGLSTLAHSHLDGNTINRLTWKNRIWLFDMDQFRTHPKHHNGVTIVRNGESGEVPPLTELLFTHETDSMGISGTRINRWNGADWSRFIVWRKGSFFTVLDRVTAREAGQYRLACRYRSRGEASMANDVWSVAQGDCSLRLSAADEAVRSFDYEPDDIKRNWKEYPYGHGTEIFCRTRERAMASGESFDFASHLRVTSGKSAAPSALTREGRGFYRIKDADYEGFILLRGCELPPGINRLAADVAWLDRNGLEACGLTLIRAGALDLSFSDPVQLSFNAAAGKGVIKSAAGAKTISLASVDFQALLASAQALGSEPVRPEPARQFADFGFFKVKELSLPTAVTAATPFNGGVMVGDAEGVLRKLDNDTVTEWSRLPRPLPVGFLAGLDMDGKAGDELLASALDLSAGILDSVKRGLIHDITLNGAKLNARAFAFNGDGKPRWEQVLTPNYGDALVTAADVIRGNGGRPEIVVAATNGWKMFGFAPGDGRILFSPFVKYHRLTAVKVLEDKTGRKIATGTEYITPVSLFSDKGKELWHAWEQMGSESKAKTEYLGYHLTAIAFQDVDRDKEREILFSTRNDRVYAVKSGHCELVWQADVGDEALCLLAVDTSRNNGPVSLVGTAAGDVVLLDRGGKKLNALTLGSAVLSIEKMAAPLPGRTDATILLKNGHVAVVDDILKLRAYFNPGFPVQKLIPLRSMAGEARLALVGNDRISIIRHSPSIRKECRYY